MHAGAVAELRVPISTALWRQVQHVIHGAQKVEATLLDIVGHRRMRTVEVAKRAGAVSDENRDRRVLVSFAIFATHVVFEGVGAATEEPEPIPASAARMRSQGG